MQSDHPQHLLSYIAEMLPQGAILCRGSDGCVANVSISTDESANSKVLEEGLGSVHGIRSLQDTIARTFAASGGNYAGRCECANALRKVAAALRNLDGKMANSVPNFLTLIIPETASLYSTAGGARGSSEGGGEYGVQYALESAPSKLISATTANLKKLSDGIRDFLGELGGDVKIQKESEEVMAAIDGLRPYIDGAKPINEHGGYADAILKSVYYADRIGRLNTTTEASTIDDFFEICYSSVKRVYAEAINPECKCELPRKIIVVAREHTYAINAYMLYPYIRSGLPCSEALSHVAKDRVPFIDPNWMNVLFAICETESGVHAPMKIRRKGEVELGDRSGYGECAYSERIFAPGEVPVWLRANINLVNPLCLSECIAKHQLIPQDSP
jgi:hypothetical protein